MPVFSPQQRKIARQQFGRYMHNDTLSVQLAISRDKSTVMPGYDDMESAETVNYGTFSGFKCSVYDMLSGKLSRIFRNRIYEVAMEFGIWDDVAYLIQYIDTKYILEAHTGTATNVVSSNTILNDSAIDFTTLKIRANFEDGTIGAQVFNLTDGSIANVVSITDLQIVTDGLTGGINNEFALGDSYKIMNVNNLKVGDRVYIDNDWREILAVIKDSEGIQHTAFSTNG